MCSIHTPQKHYIQFSLNISQIFKFMFYWKIFHAIMTVASHNLTCRQIYIFNMTGKDKVRLRIRLNGVKLP